MDTIQQINAFANACRKLILLNACMNEHNFSTIYINFSFTNRDHKIVQRFFTPTLYKFNLQGMRGFFAMKMSKF